MSVAEQEITLAQAMAAEEARERGLASGGAWPYNSLGLSEQAQSPILQLLMQMMKRKDAPYKDPLVHTALQQQVQQGAVDQSRFAYGPTKAGPFVFFPSQAPPTPSNSDLMGPIGLTGLTNVVNSLAKRYQDSRGEGALATNPVGTTGTTGTAVDPAQRDDELRRSLGLP